VHSEARAQVLAALGLDVIDVHLADVLDGRDLETLRLTRRQTGKLKGLRELVGLARINEADVVGEAVPVAERPDGKIATALPVGATISLVRYAGSLVRYAGKDD
jgi:hypothetical protein